MLFSRRAIIAWAIVLVLVGVSIGWYVLSHRLGIKDITVAASGMRIEVVTDPALQEKGLSNRTSIEDNYGMLFVFKDKDRYGFWMKDMLVPIDIIWLSDNGSILLIDHSVEPSTYPNVFYPPVPVQYVLETRAGYARDHNWDVGTNVPLPSPYGS